MVYRLGCRGLGLPRSSELYYVSPGYNWVTDQVGNYITRNISDQFGWRTHVTSAPHLLVDHILHYGEIGAFLTSLGSYRNSHNTIVATIFHGDRTPQFPELKHSVDQLLENAQVTNRIVTVCSIMEKRLIAWGVPSDKIVRIPLGVDLSHFKPPRIEQRRACRSSMGIPDDAVCVGSFQKDGSGWEEGLSPKLIKGPDIFLKVIQRLHKHYNLFVLLTAPARGYVKRGLESIGVAYRHKILTEYKSIADMFHCLDLYLVTSREEGGPIAVLESLATGVPLVSTRVGLVPDIVQHGHNGMLADSEEVDLLSEHAAQIIEQDELRNQIVANGLEDISSYSWTHIATRYYQELYLPLLNPSQ